MCAQNQYLELQVWYRHTTVFTQPMIQSTTKKFIDLIDLNIHVRVSSKKSLWQQCGMGSAILRTWALKLIIIYSSQVGSAWKSCSREFCITSWFQQTWLFDSTTYRVYYTLLASSSGSPQLLYVTDSKGIFKEGWLGFRVRFCNIRFNAGRDSSDLKGLLTSDSVAATTTSS